MTDKSNLIKRVFLRSLKPDPIITVSDWADKNRLLSSKTSSEPGRWKTSRTPYLKKIMDALSVTTEYQQIIVMKGVQLGFSEMGNNWIGYIIDKNPGPVMVVQPTLEMAKRFSRQRIDSLFEDTESISKKVSTVKSRDASNTVFIKDFDGGILALAGANSAKGLRMMPIRYLFLDEIDAYPGDVENEGDPINLAIKRTSTFSRRKILMGSTPTTEARSNVYRLFQLTDQNYYYVPCPFCGDYFVIEFKNLHYSNDKLGRPDLSSVSLQCVSCNNLIDEHYKTEMLTNGEWRHTVDDNINKKRIGFHISSLYSPLGWYSWQDAVNDFHESKNNVQKRKGFINTVLGEVWKDKGEAPDWKRLYNRRENYKIGTVPKDGKVLTMAVDVQADRLEIGIMAWGKNMVNWQVSYRVIVGNTSERYVWSELRKMFSETFEHESGSRVSISKTAIDSGFNTQTVYNFVRQFPIQTVFAIKGSDSLQQIASRPKDVDVRSDGRKIRRGAKLFTIGSSMIKNEIYGWLKQDEPDEGNSDPFGYCHFPEYEEEYFKMLTAEELVRRKVKGFDRWHWEKTRERNESLDIFVMNRACAYLIGLDRYSDSDWDKIQFAKPAKKLDNAENFKRKTLKRKKTSSFWD